MEVAWPDLGREGGPGPASHGDPEATTESPATWGGNMRGHITTRTTAGIRGGQYKTAEHH